MTEEKKPDTPDIPWLLINPKIAGQGTVYRKDGTVSTPDTTEQPKEKDNGNNDS